MIDIELKKALEDKISSISDDKELKDLIINYLINIDQLSDRDKTNSLEEIYKKMNND
jgi:hypothetical protein